VGEYAGLVGEYGVAPASAAAVVVGAAAGGGAYGAAPGTYVGLVGV
jgi:hypothetical protein